MNTDWQTEFRKTFFEIAELYQDGDKEINYLENFITNLLDKKEKEAVEEGKIAGRIEELEKGLNWFKGGAVYRKDGKYDEIPIFILIDQFQESLDELKELKEALSLKKEPTN